MHGPNMKISTDSIVVATDSQVSTALNAETVILHFNKGAYFGLNEVGTVVWQKLQEPHTVAAIRDAIVAEYDVDEGQCEQDVLRLLNKLRDEGLIEVRIGPAA
jgi:Coenzyme PQQ synthesis protein D (PqqD)